MFARLRIVVPDRPGSLGAVASAIGAAGADVDMVDVLASEYGRATDDVRVRVSNGAHLERLVASLDALGGVTVTAVTAPVSPDTVQGELELIRTVVQSPSIQILADQAAGSLGMEWAATCRVTDPATSTVAASSVGGPAVGTVIEHPVRLGMLPKDHDLPHPRKSEDTSSAVALVPLRDGEWSMVLARGGVDFHSSEIHRLGELGKILGALMVIDVRLPSDTSVSAN